MRPETRASCSRQYRTVARSRSTCREPRHTQVVVIEGGRFRLLKERVELVAKVLGHHLWVELSDGSLHLGQGRVEQGPDLVDEGALLDQLLLDRLSDARLHLVDSDRGHDQAQPPICQVFLERLKGLPVKAEAGGDKDLGVQRDRLHHHVVRHGIYRNEFTGGSPSMTPTETTRKTCQ